MRRISVEQACAELPQVLAEVAAGTEIIIERDAKPIARLTRIVDDSKRQRPKVGELRGAAFHIPDEAFAPLSAEELKEWGL